ncbi:MAG: hypothetical protein ACKO6N_27495 [Myxococcota bacterium]
MKDFGLFRSRSSLLAASFGLALSLAACSGSTPEESPTPEPTDKPDTPTPVPPFNGRVTILELAYNQVVVLGQEKTLEVEFKAEGFTLANKGGCGTAVNCGRVRAEVDGVNLGESATSPVTLDFTKLTDPAGSQKIELKLIFDNGTETGASDDQTVIVQVPTPPDETPPGIVITAPALNALTVLGSDGMKTVPVSFQVTNITLAAPGECGGVEGNCGHVHVKLDGDEGNAPGQEYNNTAVTADEPAKAFFSYLDDDGWTSRGIHTISLELHKDDHTPYTAGDTDQVIAANTTVRALDATDPFLELFVDPTEALQFGLDGLMTVSVDFSVDNFDLAAPETCGGPGCGYIRILLDGTVGNMPDESYNNLITGTDLAYLHYYWLQAAGIDPTGRHAVTLELVDDGGNPVIIEGPADPEDAYDFPLTVAATALTQLGDYYTAPFVTIQTPANNANVAPDEAGKVAVRVSATNFVGQAGPTPCQSGTYCGKFCLQIDGDEGNQTGKSCNAESDKSPIDADFKVFTDPTGTHVITVKLIRPDGTTYTLNSTDGTPYAILDNTIVNVRGAAASKR